jgi:hypothetical protein
LAFEDDSSYQNCAEFIGAIMVIVVMLKLGYRDIKVKLRGDSVTALTWAWEQRFRSDLINNASVVFILLLTMTGTEIVGHEHIPAEENWRCDGLSRPKLGKTLVELGICEVPFFDLNTDANVCEIVQLCNPTLLVDSEEDFANFWRRAQSAISALL